MNPFVWEWMKAPSGKTKIPKTIAYSYCPNDPGHWRVEQPYCPVCYSPIETAMYKLRDTEHDSADVA